MYKQVNNIHVLKQYTSTQTIYKYSNNIQVLKQYTSTQHKLNQQNHKHNY